MKNFLIITIVPLIFLVLIVLAASKTVTGNFTYETKAIFDVNKDLLWDIVNNVDAYLKNKYVIVSLEKKDYQGETLISWRENYNFGISKDYEVIIKDYQENLVLKIRNNFTGMVTVLDLHLSEDEKKTYLNVKEDSEVNNVLYRGLKVLGGKEAYANSQIKWIRVGLYNHLIKK